MCCPPTPTPLTPSHHPHKVKLKFLAFRDHEHLQRLRSAPGPAHVLSTHQLTQCSPAACQVGAVPLSTRSWGNWSRGLKTPPSSASGFALLCSITRSGWCQSPSYTRPPTFSPHCSQTEPLTAPYPAPRVHGHTVCQTLSWGNRVGGQAPWSQGVLARRRVISSAGGSGVPLWAPPSLP